MVYCGKPSKCCQNCRKRDIKCDKRKESCGQCIRLGLVCPGYPDPLDLVFRNETKKITDKLKKPIEGPKSILTTHPRSVEQPNRGPNSTKLPHSIGRYSPRFQPASIPSNQSESSSHIIYPLIDSLEVRAKTFFARSKIFSKHPCLPTHSFLFSLSLSSPLLLHMMFAVRAVSLMHLSKHQQSSSIMQTARQNYVAALKQTQVTISNAAGAEDNSTLVAVLFLDIFERLVGRENTAEEAFESGGLGHLNGAMALIKFRGEKQFNDSIGMSLFQQLSSTILTRCLEGEVEVPLQYVALRKLAARSRDTSDARWRFEEIVVQLTSLKALVRNERNWGCQNNAAVEILRNQCMELYYDLQGPHVYLADMQQDPILNCDPIGSTRTKQRLLQQLILIRIVLAEYTPLSPPDLYIRRDMEALCTSIYATSIATPAAVLFPLYVAASSRFCPRVLKQLIHDNLKEQKNDDDALKVVQLLERSVDDLEAAGLGMSNPWKDFAEEGLGELSTLEML